MTVSCLPIAYLAHSQRALQPSGVAGARALTRVGIGDGNRQGQSGACGPAFRRAGGRRGANGRKGFVQICAKNTASQAVPAPHL